MKNKLKNKLKRLLPPCSATVRSYKEQIEQQNRELYDLLISIKNQVTDLQNEILMNGLNRNSKTYF